MPQAFSHFSLFYSERPLSQVKGKDGVAGRCLACDLQGCFQRDQNTFTLFDPVIHSELGEKSLESSPSPGPRPRPRPRPRHTTAADSRTTLKPLTGPPNRITQTPPGHDTNIHLKMYKLQRSSEFQQLGVPDGSEPALAQPAV